MTLTPNPPARTAGVSGGGAVALVVSLVVGLTVLPFAFYAIVMSIRGTPELEGYRAEPISCEFDPATGYALLELSVAQLDYSDATPRVIPPRGDDVQLVGVSTLPAGTALNDLDSADRRILRAALEQGQDWADVTPSGRTVVIALERTSREPHELETIDLWWSPGEPAYIQKVPIDLRWAGSTCTLG